MSASDVQNEILDPMQRLFLPPRKLTDGEEQAVLRDYVHALEQFCKEDLRVAWQDLVETHTTRSWPLPSAIIKSARQALKERAIHAPAESNPFSKVSPNVAWEGWKSVRNTALAKEAVKRRVAWALKCAIVNDNLRPEQIDLRELELGKASAERTAAKIESREIPMKPEIRETALAMWRTLQIREAETEQEINYRGASA